MGWKDPREQAEWYVDEAIDCCSSENAPEAALGFIDAFPDRRTRAVSRLRADRAGVGAIAACTTPRIRRPT